MNKAQLIEALTERLGDKKTAGAAVDGLVDVIVRTVNKGEKVNITGFGVFEKRARAARTARNPRTGETVKVKKTNVPAFRPGTGFKEVVSGAKKLPKVAAAKSATSRSTGTTTRAAATRSTASTRTRAAAATTTARKTAAKPAATKAAAKPAAAKTTTTRRAAAKPAAAKTSAKAPAKKTSAAAAKKPSTRKK
ncbi:DNA-binding protein [Actinosynnema sp. ALI-1.44]|uniref:HU family DNA-binding protein n=1 Tax=Actinosynnema sp. ALI-1.44 TaxID=1933779 RepID=UPI00097BD82E|nr:HU family DNA-binding protein [Actinosynnema sp. ALI-1.44]ONI70293.1 DNA-binding protein [Actinosynnema sp. ALI-1.44]